MVIRSTTPSILHGAMVGAGFTPMLSTYHKYYPWVSLRASPEHPVGSLQGITMNDILFENQTISFWLVWEQIFKKAKKIWKIWEPLTWVRVSEFSCQKKLVQAIRKKMMSIKLNYVSMQNWTMFYLLDLVPYSWTMGLNFGDPVLSHRNLITVKGKDTFITKPTSKSACQV